jgi:acetyl esterase/lipase
VLERVVFKRFRADDPDAFRGASPIFRVTPDAPPFFVIHGDRDSLVPVAEARRFVETLREASREPVLYAEMKGGQHAFDIVPSFRTAPVIEAVERFLHTIHARRGAPAEATEREAEAALT